MHFADPRRWVALWATLFLASSSAACTPPALCGDGGDSSSPSPRAEQGADPLSCAPELPVEECEVVRVVDGDTLHVRRDGAIEKLRLLSVDTEEKIRGGGFSSPSKPQTVFGTETSEWARELFASLAGEDGVTRIGLRFPAGKERRDVFGRLLCHVVLPDGRDYNLLLVRTGRSPYFQKYGRSLLCHEAFLRAQDAARRERLGIWDPATNAPKTPGTPTVQRPYERLLPWWSARAEAIENFKRRHALDPAHVVHAEHPDELARALAEAGEKVTVFGEIDRLFEETDGSLTVLFRGADRRHALRVVIPAGARAAHAALDLAGRRQEYRQNYLFVTGRLERGTRGLQMTSTGPAAWEVAGPEVPQQE